MTSAFLPPTRPSLGYGEDGAPNAEKRGSCVILIIMNVDIIYTLGVSITVSFHFTA